MKFKIERKDLFDFIIMMVLLFDVLIFKWLTISYKVEYIILTLLVVSIIAHSGLKTRNIFVIVIGVIVTCIYPLINYYFLGGYQNILFENTKRILVSFLLLLYFLFLCQYKRKFIDSFFENTWKIIDAFMFVNILVLILQILKPGILVSALGTNNAYDWAADLMSGLFGYYQTPSLAIFSSFCIVLNFYLADRTTNQRKKKIFVGIAVFYIIVFSLISVVNDNNAFYVVLILFIGIYYLIRKGFRLSSSRKRLKYLFKYFILSIFLLLLIYAILSQIQVFEQMITRMYNIIRNAIKYSEYTYGSGERFAMIAYMLKSQSKIMGVGIGNYFWRQSNVLGFAHFGQCDLGSFVVLGGFCYAILVLIYAYVIFRKLFPGIILPLLFTILIAILSLYTQLFTEPTLMISVFFFSMLCYSKYSMKNNMTCTP